MTENWNKISEQIFGLIHYLQELDNQKISVGDRLFTDKKVAYLASRDADKSLKTFHYEINIVKSLVQDFKTILEHKNNLPKIISDESLIDRKRADFLKIILERCDEYYSNYNHYLKQLEEIYTTISNNKTNYDVEFWSNLLMKLRVAKKVINIIDK
jgi:hypothetical protein